jgi:ABC-2 type transport system ATP-binding protein
MITVKGVSVQYSSALAVDNISLTMQDGRLYGMVGPNGAGKSSLIKVMVGMISEYSGEIFYDDLLLDDNRYRIKKILGYAPEDTELLPFLTGQEYLQMLAEIRRISNSTTEIESLIRDLGLQQVRNLIIDGYSHGMRQKLALAAALIGTPKAIIIDEALNGLDPITMHNVKIALRKLANEGHTILLASHILELIENLCQEILILNRGKLIGQLSQAEIKNLPNTHGKNFSDYFIGLIQSEDLKSG